MVLAGCTAEGIRGAAASSVEECRADWERDRHAANAGIVATGSVAALVVSTLVSTAASVERRQRADDQFRMCLARYNVTDADAFLAAAGDTDFELTPATAALRAGSTDTPLVSSSLAATNPQPLAVVPAASCSSNASVLSGGAGYCQ